MLTQRRKQIIDEAMRSGHAFTYRLADHCVKEFVGFPQKVVELADIAMYSGDNVFEQYEAIVAQRLLKDKLQMGSKEAEALAEKALQEPDECITAPDGRKFSAEYLATVSSELKEAFDLMRCNGF